MTIVRANHWQLTDEGGRRTASPVRIEQLLITLTDAKGEVVCYVELPMDRLPANEQ